MEIHAVGASGPQSSSAPPPDMSSNREEETVCELEKASKPSVKCHNDLADDDEKDVCRICWAPGDEFPLYYPCACRGSIKYVHQDCLLQWLNCSNARQCKICKHAFVISAVYAENTPSKLQSREFLLGMVRKADRGMRFIIRLMVFLWLLFNPVIVQQLASRISHRFPSLSESLLGLLVLAGIHFIYWSSIALRKYFYHPLEFWGQEGHADNGRAGRQFDREVHHIVGRGADFDLQEALLQSDGVNGDLGRGQGVAPAGGGEPIRRNEENAAGLEWHAARDVQGQILVILRISLGITPLREESLQLLLEEFGPDEFAKFCLKIPAPIRIILIAKYVTHVIAERRIFPSFGYSLIVYPAVSRLAWLGSLGTAVSWYSAMWLLDLPNSIRNDRYLVGRRLHNYGD